MDHFELVSEYAPTGDQPETIEALVIAHNKTLAAQLYGEFKELLKNKLKTIR